MHICGCIALLNVSCTDMSLHYNIQLGLLQPGTFAGERMHACLRRDVLLLACVG